MDTDLTISSGYLDALMSGIKAGQERVEARKKAARSAAQQSLAQGSMGSVGGGQYANAPVSGDWGNPIGDPNFARNYLTTIRLPNGQNVLVHKNIAQQASGFFNELWNSGYKFGEVQTYNKRKTQSPKGRGNSWSRHSTGLAFDIDPAKNPWSGPYALPKNTGQIAAKYGLYWGVQGSKPGLIDAMHVGYGAPQWQGVAQR